MNRLGLVNRRLLIVAGIGVAVLGAWFVLLWGPQGGKLSDLEARRTAAVDQNAQLELRLARLQDAQDRAPALMASVDELQRAVPDDPQLAEFILDLNHAATEADVDFQSVSPSPPAPSEAGGLSQINLAISIKGTYFAVMDYLEQLEDLPRLVVVDTLNLTPESPEQMSLNLTARMFTSAVTSAVAPAPGAPGVAPTTPTTAPPAPTTPTTVQTAAPVVAGSVSNG